MNLGFMLVAYNAIRNKMVKRLESDSHATLTQDHAAPSGLPDGVESPYQFKDDPYSSHSVILSRLGTGCGRRLLDVGAAHGYLAAQLTQRGYAVTCIEGNPKLATLAADKCHAVFTADLDRDIPKLENVFDVIVCGDVLEHLKDPLRVLIELTRRLTAEGTVVISVPNIAHVWVRLQLLLGRFEYTDRGILDRTHLRFFTLASIQRLIDQAGLTLIELIATPVPLPLVIPKRYHGRLLAAVHAFNAVLARAWKSLFAYQFIAIAQRRCPNDT